MLCFLGDVSMPKSLSEVAFRYGHEFARVHDYGLLEADDVEILRVAARQTQIVLTVDVGFSRDVMQADFTVPGLVLFRLGNVTAAEIKSAFERLLESLTEEQIESSICVVEPDRIRRRVLLTESG